MPRTAGKDGRRQGIGRRPPWALPAAALVAALLAAGCSVGGQEEQEGASGGNGIPDTIAVGLVHRVSQNGHLSIELRAARAETYNDAKKTILTDAHFVEYDDKGATATEGTARTVTYHTDSDDAEVSGGVTVRSRAEKGTVSADSLSWQNKERLLTAPPDEIVSLHKDDGTTVSGSGFSGDFRARELQFNGPVNGTYVSASAQ